MLLPQKNYIIAAIPQTPYMPPGHVLRDIDLNVGKSDVVVIIGASGSGKSTLLRCINLLEEPSSGEIWIEGNIVDRRKKNGLNILRRDVGMVFQHFNLFPHFTVLGNITEAPVQVRFQAY